MGTFTVHATISHPNEPSRRQELSLLVDTGAAYLEQFGLGVDPLTKKLIPVRVLLAASPESSAPAKERR